MHRAKILIVDDTAENLQILVEVLRDEYAVAPARSGEKALLLAAAPSPPDLILLDVMMPGMDGFETCLRLKANPATAAIPVLFITALNDEASEVRALTVGGVDFITKPINPVVVLARVRSQLELKVHKDLLEVLVAKRTRELVRTQDVTIATLANLAETRDPETGGHIKRTQAFVRILAEELARNSCHSAHLTPEIIELLGKSAPLHDVGKVGVPDHILLKPGKLTDDEFKEMKKHSVYGWNALKGALKELGENSFMRYAAEIALSHHEKWDGTGYPKGVQGETIPLSGRIMAVADVYDALVCKRVYKPPFSHAKAVEIIAQGSGSHFEPVLVAAFLARQEEIRQVAARFADSEEERKALDTP